MELVAGRCHLKSQHLEKLLEGMNGAKLTMLDVSYNKLSLHTWLFLGRIFKRSGSMGLAVKSCDLTSRNVEKLIEGMNGAKLTVFKVSYNNKLLSDGWLLIGRIVKLSGLMELDVSGCDLTSQHVKKLAEGMDGAKLDQLYLTSIESSFTSSLLKLLPLVNEDLYISHWNTDEQQQERLQRKLDEEQLTPLTIKLEKFSHRLELQADPMDFPTCQFTRELPGVDNVTAKQDGDGILVTWDPLSDYDNVSYYIEVKSEGKRVGEPVTCTDTEYRMCSIQPKTKYYLCVWGFTDVSVSWSLSWSKCETGDIPLIARVQNQGFDDFITETIGKKRHNQGLNAVEGNACKHKKAKRLDSESLIHDYFSRSRQNPQSSSLYGSRKDHAPLMLLAAAEPAAGLESESSTRDFLSESRQNPHSSSHYGSRRLLASAEPTEELQSESFPHDFSSQSRQNPHSSSHYGSQRKCAPQVRPTSAEPTEGLESQSSTHDFSSRSGQNPHSSTHDGSRGSHFPPYSPEPAEGFTDHQCTIECKVANLENMVNQKINNLQHENQILRESLENQQKEMKTQKREIDALNSTLAKQQREIADLRDEKKTPQRRSRI